MSQSARARDWGAKDKGKAPAYSHPRRDDPDTDQAPRPKHLRFLVLDLVEPPWTAPTIKDRVSARPDPADDLAAKVADLQTHVDRVRRTLGSGTGTGTVPEGEMRRARGKLRAAMQGVRGVEQEMDARVKGNEARISRMEKKLLAMRRAV